MCGERAIKSALDRILQPPVVSSQWNMKKTEQAGGKFTT